MKLDKLEQRILIICVVCLIGSLIKQYIPSDYQYLFGFIVGTALCTYNSIYFIKK